MILTENINLEDSAVFSMYMRTALVEQIVSSNGSEKEIKYVQEEMSNGSMLSLLAFGKIPPTEFNENEIYEMALSHIKTNILENIDLFCIEDKTIITEFVHNVGMTEEILTERLVWRDNIPGRALQGIEDWVRDAGGEGTIHKALRQSVDSMTRGEVSFAKWLHKAANSDAAIIAKEGMAIATIVGAVGYFGYKIYQRYLSKSASKCHNLTGTTKNKCLEKARILAMQKQVSDMKTNISACAKTKDPSKCKSMLSKKIKELEDKIKVRKSI